MPRLRTTLAATALVVTAEVLAPVGSALAAGRIVTDTRVVVTRDEARGFDHEFDVRSLDRSVVDPVTRARATAKGCEGCRAAALSYQVVLVQRVVEPANVRPVVVAEALNEACTTCDTVVATYQYVVGRGGPIKLTGEGKRALAAVEDDVAELRRSGLGGQALVDAADDLGDRVQAILDAQVVRTDGSAAKGKVERRRSVDTDETEPEQSTTSAPIG